MSKALEKAEELLFEQYADHATCAHTPLVFILASPRTGSTLIYQLLINLFDFFYFSNFVADNYGEFPAVGAALDWLANPHKAVGYESDYGKTRGDFGPSEASSIFRNWFGGSHPSQIRSSKVLSEKKEHMLLSLNAIFNLTNKPILTKNAWNCFRIEELSRMFPNLLFIWVRRDIARSAISDLEARYRSGGAHVWNSATTSSYREIQKLPYWEQVVEQQYEYNKSMARDLYMFCSERYIEIWYEDVCVNAEREVQRVEDFFSSCGVPVRRVDPGAPNLNRSKKKQGIDSDAEKILRYIGHNRDRLADYIYVPELQT